MTDNGNELSEILSETPAPAAASGAETTTTETTNTDGAQPRGADGKFAPKAGDAPQSEQQPAVTQQPATTEEQPRHNIPPAALQDEREKTREARAEADDLRRQLAELSGKVSVLTQQRQQPPAQQQEAPKPKDFWEDPSAFVQEALSPMEKLLQRQQEGFSRRLAIKEHGAEKVTAAYEAIKTALQSDPAASFEYRRIMSTDDPYEELVKWHAKQSTLSRIGGDPDKWLEAEIEKRLNDPAQQAAILQRIQQSASQPNANNRSAPVTKLPPSLSSLPGGTNNAPDADLSDAGLFANATAGLGRRK